MIRENSLEHAASDQKNAQVSTGERIGKAVLWPGEKVCDLINIEGSESRMLFRMFINLSIYAKIVVIMALFAF